MMVPVVAIADGGGEEMQANRQTAMAARMSTGMADGCCMKQPASPVASSKVVEIKVTTSNPSSSSCCKPDAPRPQVAVVVTPSPAQSSACHMRTSDAPRVPADKQRSSQNSKRDMAAMPADCVCFLQQAPSGLPLPIHPAPLPVPTNSSREITTLQVMPVVLAQAMLEGPRASVRSTLGARDILLADGQTSSPQSRFCIWIT